MKLAANSQTWNGICGYKLEGQGQSLRNLPNNGVKQTKWKPETHIQVPLTGSKSQIQGLSAFTVLMRLFSVQLQLTEPFGKRALSANIQSTSNIEDLTWLPCNGTREIFLSISTWRHAGSQPVWRPHLGQWGLILTHYGMITPSSPCGVLPHWPNKMSKTWLGIGDNQKGPWFSIIILASAKFVLFGSTWFSHRCRGITLLSERLISLKG